MKDVINWQMRLLIVKGIRLWSVLIFFAVSTNGFACKLNDQYEYYSLSSPITMLFEELELLNQVEAISTFHPVKNNKIKKLAGGIFLTKNAFKTSSKIKKKRIVFFDQSIEMRRNLSKVKEITLLEVFTRSIGAFEAYEVSKEIASSFLINCEEKLKKVDLKVKSIKQKVSKLKVNKTVLFYLGMFKKNKKDPDLLIVNDGFVKDFKGKINSYPSELDYVTWSAKIMKGLPKDTLKISVTDSKQDKISLSVLDNGKYSILFRGALSPGLRQVYLIEEILKLNILK